MDAQCGATFLRRLVEQQQFHFQDEPDINDEGPLVVAYAASQPVDPSTVERATALQRWLNSHPGIYLKVDGWPGRRTSNAYKKVTGSYLPGDPR